MPYDEATLRRFWSKVPACSPNECWPWKGAPDTGGYARFKYKGRSYLAHRFVYELVVGPIPAGLELDHLCRKPLCVNPAHLEAVSHQENCRRGDLGGHAQRAKTHCPYGHPYDEANTYVHPSSGSRHCRICIRAGWRKQNARRKASGWYKQNARRKLARLAEAS